MPSETTRRIARNSLMWYFKDNAYLNDRGARLFTASFNEKIGQVDERKK